MCASDVIAKSFETISSHRSVGVVATLNLLERWRAGEPMRALGVPHKGREYTECATFSQLFSLVDGWYASVRCMNVCVRVYLHMTAITVFHK